MNRPPDGLRGALPPARPVARASLRRHLSLRNLALALVAAGVLAFVAPFAMVGYGMWEESQLTQNWTAQAVEPDASPTDVPAAPADTPTPTPRPRPAIRALFAIRVPKIGYYAAVQEGVSLNVLATGPGHYPASALPGKPGLVAIAAHNTFWIPFGRLGSGDTVVLETRYGKFSYQVTGTKIVNPDDASVLVPSSDPRLVLTTCWPLWAGNLAPQRLAIFAQRV